MRDTFKLDPKINHHGLKDIYKLMLKHNIKANHLAHLLQVQTIRIYEILNLKRRITADTDLRLCKLFKLKDGHFLNLQTQYDLALTREKISAKLKQIKTIDQLAIK